MSFEIRSTDDLASIAAAGGGLIIDANVRPTADLQRIAAAGSRSGARLLFRGMTVRPVADLLSIAASGNGCVQFEG